LSAPRFLGSKPGGGARSSSSIGYLALRSTAAANVQAINNDVAVVKHVLTATRAERASIPRAESRGSRGRDWHALEG